MTVLERIKKISKKRGYSLAQVNEKAHLGTNTIYSWKTKEPSFNNLQAVAKVLDVSVDYLLGKTDIETPKKETRDLEVEEALNSVRTYQGKPISDAQRETMKGIIRAYLDAQDKNE
ncbi:helix-turn-helix domain-containing protein [Pediococcus acidilactici]|uniref:helix-turn-helix domain-containing protein n=1 Tax=Pediococcus acidilactici TaxID=1254 RepID=UPI0013276DBD|nr:helix-turn-helix transcriptional regulator [Pediococcus acidilactici]KAF0375327.1 helix-turn-helix domain-containing protein [Pediococcus acidilactici]KAF0406719.1 helix-turn-helix domain-containing protein [Pediococcus acidilactici]KAF0418194.1 helix-turn-helix domain-containing protein [Pediococcus acidilactici]KAF0455475.1 helix-turn-helix domain-containing protein [Pediococcus acidilactici]KAF0486547.1 helix-turn-helix domain-containing protein [Pediococcus acidilactici]